MLFNSLAFAIFFVGFVPLYVLVRGHVHRRNLLLIVASYLFYGWWDPRFLILVAISTSVDYMAALGASGKTVYTLSDQKTPAGFAGQRVRVAGTLDEKKKAILVESITALQK